MEGWMDGMDRENGSQPVSLSPLGQALLPFSLTHKGLGSSGPAPTHPVQSSCSELQDRWPGRVGGGTFTPRHGIKPICFPHLPHQSNICQMPETELGIQCDGDSKERGRTPPPTPSAFSLNHEGQGPPGCIEISGHLLLTLSPQTGQAQQAASGEMD